MTDQSTEDTLRACRVCRPMRSWDTAWYPESGENCPGCGSPGEIPPPLVPPPDEPPVSPAQSADPMSNPTLVELDIRAKTYDLMVLEQARERARAMIAGNIEMPWVHRLDAFLKVEDEPVTHRVTGLWPSGGRVVLSAQNKAGKTTMVGNLVRSLVDGEAFLGHFPVERALKVILLDNELDERMLRRWLRDQNIAAAASVEVVPLRGVLSTFNVLDRTVRTRWAKLLGEADVLVFDCLRPALDALGLSEDKDAGRFLEAMDELTTEAGIGETLIVHHMGHSGERSRGDSRILDWPDAIWKLVKGAEEDDEESTERRVYFTAYGRDVDQPETLLKFDPATRRLTVAGGSRREIRAETVLASVVDYLADHPDASKNTVERHVGGRAELVRLALDLAVQRGLVERRREGSAIRHTLTSSTSSHLVRDERTTPLEDLVPSSIGRGRGREEEQTKPSDLVRDEVEADTCATCGKPPEDKAGLGARGLCAPCELVA